MGGGIRINQLGESCSWGSSVTRTKIKKNMGYREGDLISYTKGQWGVYQDKSE